MNGALRNALRPPAGKNAGIPDQVLAGPMQAILLSLPCFCDNRSCSPGSPQFSGIFNPANIRCNQQVHRFRFSFDDNQVVAAEFHLQQSPCTSPGNTPSQRTLAVCHPSGTTLHGRAASTQPAEACSARRGDHSGRHLFIKIVYCETASADKILYIIERNRFSTNFPRREVYPEQLALVCKHVLPTF